MLERPYIFDIVNYRPYKHISPEQGTYTTIEMLSGISSGANHISFFGHCRLLKQVLKCLIRFNNWCFPEKAMVTIELPVKFNELRLTWTLPRHFSSRFLHPKEYFSWGILHSATSAACFVKLECTSFEALPILTRTWQVAVSLKAGKLIP